MIHWAITAIALATQAATAVLSHQRTFLEGAVANTIVLPNGWQMTPQSDQCVLTHNAASPQRDLFLLAPRDGDQLVLAVILPTKGAYTAPTQLAVVAQDGSAKQIGRVTFNPTTGALGTLLMANWPIAALLPRLEHATRLDFYAPDRRLIRSVQLAGSVEAVAQFRRCLGITRGPENDPVTPRPHVVDVGWVAVPANNACQIARMSAKGNEFDILYTRTLGLTMVYRLLEGPQIQEGSTQRIVIHLIPSSTAQDIVEKSDGALPISMKSVRSGDQELLVGKLSEAFLRSLSEPRWNSLTLRSSVRAGVNIDDNVRTDGSAAAINKLYDCVEHLDG